MAGYAQESSCKYNHSNLEVCLQAPFVDERALRAPSYIYSRWSYNICLKSFRHDPWVMNLEVVNLKVMNLEVWNL